MGKKFLLTSFIALGFAGFVGSAMAEPSHEGSFPTTTKLLLADYTYRNAAKPANMAKKESGDIWAIPQYDPATYTLVPTKYLPMSSETLAECVAGNYCPGYDENGESDVYYSETMNQGMFACPEGFASSASGAKTEYQCYRSCAGTDVVHAASVSSGRNYYGAPATSCSPSACQTGYTLMPPESTGVGAQELINKIGSLGGGHSAWVNDHGAFEESVPTGNSAFGSEYYSMYALKTGFWAVDYNSQGTLNGMARLSRNQYTGQAGATEEQLGSSNSGQYCYCKITGYRPYSADRGIGKGIWQDFIFSESAPTWIYASDHTGNGGCPEVCAQYMKDSPNTHPLGDATFRNAVLYSLYGGSSTTPAQCAYSFYTIHWSGATRAQITENNADKLIPYGGDINTPSGYNSADVPPGKEFKGWKLSASPSSSN